MTRNNAAVPLLAAVTLLAACQDELPPTSAAPAAPGGPNIQVNVDADQLAREIPGFGGIFLDESGTPTVRLVDPAQKGKAARVLSSFLAAHGRTEGQLRVLPADYEHRQLKTWHQRINEVLATPGVVYTDLDEVANRVVVGVESGSLSQGVLASAMGYGLPRGAVEVRQVEPIRTAATLRDQIRPVVAGLQIHYGNYVCTLGFNAGHSAGNSFITNSHCTNTQGGTEGTQYYQSISTQAGSFIGTEAADPQYVKGGACPKGKKCRYSDAARVSYAAGVNFSLGVVAQPISAGSLTIGGSWGINAEQGSAVVGEAVSKVGRTTGLSTGVITNTCVNTSVQGSQVLQFCQNFVQAAVGSGDSGSPVVSANGNGVALRGILWGGSSTTFVYSPINQVEQELGALTTF